MPEPSLTPLQFAALAMYEEGPRHPYEIYQEMLRRSEDRLVKVRPGTLYHAINRLAEAGLVVEYATGRDGNRPERTTYAITEPGREAALAALKEMLRRRAEEYPEFPLAVAELSMLTPAEAAEHLAVRAGALRADLAALSAVEPALRAKALPEVLWIEHSWLVTTLGADLEWTERLVARLRSGDLAWTAADLAAHAHEAPAGC